MAFLKLDTSKLNNRYGRSKPKERSQQVTTFNSPAKNRAPEVPKTEAKEGDVLSYFDESGGKVLTSFDGGYQAESGTRVEDKDKVEKGTIRGRNLVTRGLLKGGKRVEFGSFSSAGEETRIYVYGDSGQSQIRFHFSNLDGALDPDSSSHSRVNGNAFADLYMDVDNDIHLMAGQGNVADTYGGAYTGERGKILLKGGRDKTFATFEDVKTASADFTKQSGPHTIVCTELRASTVTTSSGDLTISASGGDISFSNENLATTGTLASGNLTVTGSMSASTTGSIGTTFKVSGNGAINVNQESIHIGSDTGASCGIWRPASLTLGFTCNDEDVLRIDSTAIFPGDDDAYDIGKSSLKWDDIYATNSTIQTSDSRLKESVADSSLGLSFLNDLRPVQYKFKDKTRRHYGLIAQELKQVLIDNSISTADFAPYIYDEATDKYGIRYGEFTSILIKAVQELSKEVEELKKK
tara:strand:+ start:1175 stop:2572 length:1398 start_codon:yes stop_codon:yes gene_type:complete